MDAKIRTGGHILIEQLALHGADTVFGVPGESFLAALDGMYQSQRVRFINARQEGGAAMMAEAYGKLTGQPGIVFATRGPGATNASSGVHVAFQDSTPLILLLGQVGRDMMEREDRIELIACVPHQVGDCGLKGGAATLRKRSQRHVEKALRLHGEG